MLISLVVPVEHRYRETRGGTQWSFEVVFPSLIGGAVAIRGTHGERALVFHCHPHFLDVPGDSSGHPWISGGAGAVEIGGTLCSGERGGIPRQFVELMSRKLNQFHVGLTLN
jgi:hypothetical protein